MSIFSSFVGKKVLIRSNMSGVHVGTLTDTENDSVILTDSRRIWFWSGAFTVSEIAKDGLNDGSKIACTLDQIAVLGVCEIIPMTDTAYENVMSKPVYTV